MTSFVEKIWYDEQGLIHRDNDLPAIEHEDGSQEWWVHGFRHRDPDPITGRERPACIHTCGNLAYLKKGKMHRSDKDENGNSLPAVIYHNGTMYWAIEGKYHRTDGYAVICKSKTINGHDWQKCETWINGNLIEK